MSPAARAGIAAWLPPQRELGWVGSRLAPGYGKGNLRPIRGCVQATHHQALSKVDMTHRLQTQSSYILRVDCATDHPEYRISSHA